jgi:multidrug efflux pump subunit AcrB
MPILNINISGNYPVQFLKEKADYLKDKIEGLAEINAAEIRGVQEQKLKVEIRKYDAEAKQVSFQDIETAIKNDHLAIGAGNLKVDGIDHFVIIDGKFKSEQELGNLVVKHEESDDIRLRDVADVSFGDVDTVSYARQSGNPVVMIDIKKRGGANIIEAIDKVKVIVDEAWGTEIPKKTIEISLTNDQSVQIRSQISNLENSIIFGVILVVGVLLFFLGLRNSLFVGIAIPLSMFMSFAFLNMAGVSLNIMVLFSLVLALGMLVDNGIVVVENIYRLMDEEGMDSFEAAKKGVGEVAWPIIASTATTLAAFVPLALWPGIMGEFMKYLPITLMIVLGSSLFIALVINPVLTAVLMKVEQSVPNRKKTLVIGLSTLMLAIMFYLLSNILMGNIFMTVALLTVINAFVFVPLSARFQESFLPYLEDRYRSLLSWVMKGKRPVWIFLGTFGLLFLSFFLIGAFPPKVLFFPDNQPNYLNIFIEHPAGTEIGVTNQTTIEVKNIIENTLKENTIDVKGESVSYYDLVDIVKVKNEKGKVIGKKTIPFVESVIEQVGKGTADPAAGLSFGETPHKARITVAFCEFSHRQGANTALVMEKIQGALKNWSYADVKITVGKEANGPPQEPPINIEVSGSENYKQLVQAADQIRVFLDKTHTKGVQKLTTNVELNKAEIRIDLDREYLRRNGMSTGQIASTIRTALFGKDIATYNKPNDDESYDLNLRLGAEFRGDIDALLDQKVMFMNNRGQKLNIPIRSVVKDVRVEYTNSSIERIDLENVVTVFSDVDQGANANEIVDILKGKMNNFDLSDTGKKFKDAGLQYAFTGQLVEQEKEMAFLSSALLVAVFLILLIIVMQFNSFSTPIIILFSVVLSLVGVFMGIFITRDDFVIIMTMIGIISLAGIVVNNAIVLVDYTNLLRSRIRAERGMKETDLLTNAEILDTIIQGGKTRLRPVLLTAITTILGLIPLAIGMNINFFTLYTDLDPQIFFGGDNAIFFGAMSWTIIYGLTFSTFLTLVVVPIMYYLLYRFKLWVYRVFKWDMKINL